MRVDVTQWKNFSSDVDLTIACGLEDGLGPANFSCDVDVLGIAGETSEIGAYTTPTISDIVKDTSFTRSFGYSFPPPAQMTCGQAAFATTFQNGATAPLWQWWAGANSADCGKSPGGYSGYVLGAFGDALNTTNKNRYDIDQQILGTKFF